MDAYKIITSKGLEKQSFFDGNKIISSVEKPSSSVEKDLIEKLVKQTDTKPVVVGYDNTICFLPWEEDRFPTVSMGHFFLADTLSNENSVRKKTSLVDLGCGCGFSGNYMAKNFEGLQNGKVIFGDLFPESINAALNAYLTNNDLNADEIQIRKNENVVSLNCRGDQTIEFRLGNVSITMYGEKIDVAVASPIYIPEICEVFPQAFELFGEVSKHIGADFYVAHSSLADKVVEYAAKKTGADLTDINSRRFALDLTTTDSRMVGLCEENIEKLLPLGLIVKGSGENAQYLHELRVSKMSYK